MTVHEFTSKFPDSKGLRRIRGYLLQGSLKRLKAMRLDWFTLFLVNLTMCRFINNNLKIVYIQILFSYL